VIATNKTLGFEVQQLAEENAHGMRRCAEENLQDFEDEDHGHEHEIHCAAERTQGRGECVSIEKKRGKMIVITWSKSIAEGV
jgi:hypothetical protein